MMRFAEELSHWLKRPVIDKTGVTSEFDVELKWNLDETAATPTPDIDPSIFTAVQDRLGLKLESTKGPVEVLVIESVRRPSEN
jgi:uncharacterized protein (TIGR03435 family)